MTTTRPKGILSTFRLSLTYAGEAAIPLFVLGLYAVRRPRIGRLGLAGAVGYDLLDRRGGQPTLVSVATVT